MAHGNSCMIRVKSFGQWFGNMYRVYITTHGRPGPLLQIGLLFFIFIFYASRTKRIPEYIFFLYLSLMSSTAFGERRVVCFRGITLIGKPPVLTSISFMRSSMLLLFSFFSLDLGEDRGLDAKKKQALVGGV